ncbi:MAG TPA: hypothetical protein VGW38_11160, partial [Chloroflexota bacterium]|nr:hypothetical protein [Chloroflexota bacterium]
MPDFRSRTPLLSRLASVALVLSSVLWTYRVQPARATHVTGTELLPDLQTVPPYDIDLVTVRTGKNTERRLRFANEVE